MLYVKSLTAIVLASAVFSTFSYADIIISGTRIVYDENKKTSVYDWKIRVPAHY